MNSTTLIIIGCVIAFVVIPSFRDRTIPVKKLLIGPLIFIYLFSHSLGTDFTIFPVSYGVIAFGAFLGIMIGYMLRKSSPIIADRAQKIITLKGGFFTLYTFLIIFGVHYVIGYLKAVHPNFFMHASLANQFLLMILALTSCITLGGNGCLFIKYLFNKNLKEGV